MSKRAALYARVSTDGQVDNTSLESQLEACRRYAEQHSLKVVEEVKEIISGAFVLARPKFNYLLEMASRDLIDLIVVDIPDRLGRGDAIPQLELLARMNGAEIVYVKGGYDKNTPEGLAQHAVETLVSGMERQKWRTRSIRGKKEKAKSGKVIIGSIPPYGYDYLSESSELVINEKQAKVVRQIYKWFVHDKYTLGQIAKALRDKGVPTHYQDLGRKSTGLWRRSSIHKILSKETYCGIWYYNKTGSKRVEEGNSIRVQWWDRPREEWIPVEVPAIISRELWEAAQVQLETNRERFSGRPSRRYLLRGMLRCAACGHMMCGRTRRYKDDATCYYACNLHRKHPGGQDCENHTYLRQDTVEKLVWERVKGILLNPEMITEGLKAKQEGAKKAHKLLLDRATSLGELIAANERKIERLLDLYLDERIDKETYSDREAKLKEEIETWKREKARVEGKLKKALVTDTVREGIEAFCRKIAKRLDKVTWEDKRRILKILEIELIYDHRKDELIMTGIIPSKKLSMISA